MASKACGERSTRWSSRSTSRGTRSGCWRSIAGEPFTSFAADGLIVATPTGSTAYSLSARGPIVSPRHRALLLTPVSPHMLFDRTLVLDPSETVAIEVAGHRQAGLAVDGQFVATLERGDVVDVPSGGDDGALRAPRAAPLPSDPQGQVRARRPLTPDR